MSVLSPTGRCALRPAAAPGDVPVYAAEAQAAACSWNAPVLHASDMPACRRRHSGMSALVFLPDLLRLDPLLLTLCSLVLHPKPVSCVLGIDCFQL